MSGIASACTITRARRRGGRFIHEWCWAAMQDRRTTSNSPSSGKLDTCMVRNHPRAVREPPLRNLLPGRTGFCSGIYRLSWAFHRDSAVFFPFSRKFSSHGESAFARNCRSGVRRGFRYGGGASRPLHGDGQVNPRRRFHEDETMTKRISCGPFTPAHPGRRENSARLPGIGGSGRAVESRPGGRAGVSREIPNNSIKLDKFTGLFDKFPKLKRRVNSCKILNNNDLNINMSAGRSNKAPINFFAPRICPHIR